MVELLLFTYTPDIRYHWTQKWIIPGGVLLTHGSRNSSFRCQSFPPPAFNVSQVSWQQLGGLKITHNHNHTCLPYWLTGNLLLSALLSHSRPRVLLFQTLIIDLQFDSFPEVIILPPIFWYWSQMFRSKHKKKCNHPSRCLGISRCVLCKDMPLADGWDPSSLEVRLDLNRDFLLPASLCISKTH